MPAGLYFLGDRNQRVGRDRAHDDGIDSAVDQVFHVGRLLSGVVSSFGNDDFPISVADTLHRCLNLVGHGDAGRRSHVRPRNADDFVFRSRNPSWQRPPPTASESPGAPQEPFHDFSSQLLIFARLELSQTTATKIMTPLSTFCKSGSFPSIHDVGEETHNEDTDERLGQPPLSAGHRGSTDHGCGNGVHLVIYADGSIAARQRAQFP